MILKLTDKETKIVKWALVHWSVEIENKMKTVPEKDIWDLYEEELNILEEILKRINDEEINQCTDR